MREFRKSWLVSLLCLLAACACHTAAEDDVELRDVANDSMSFDAAQDADPTDVSDETKSDASDVDAAEEPAPLVEFDASMWQEPNPCEGTITPPEPHDTFAMPDRPPGSDPVRTRETVISDLGGVPFRARAILAAASLQPGSDGIYDLYTEPGDDVTLHFYSINGNEDLSSFRLNLGVVLDYKPVEAIYVRWNADRTQKLFEQSATGINFRVDSDVEIIDVTIPAEALPETRMYEVSVFMQTTSDEYSSSGTTRRFALYNGGYEQSQYPCFESRLDAEPTEFESVLPRRSGHIGFGTLFYEGVRQGEYLGDHVIDVEPGETQKLFFSLMRASIPEGPKPTVALPTINGKPLMAAWWLNQGGDNALEFLTKVDARKSFEVTFPTEPGIYEVQVITWVDPMRLWRNRNGVQVEGVSKQSGLHQSSNPLRYRVVDTESSP